MIRAEADSARDAYERATRAMRDDAVVLDDGQRRRVWRIADRVDRGVRDALGPLRMGAGISDLARRPGWGARARARGRAREGRRVAGGGAAVTAKFSRPAGIYG